MNVMQTKRLLCYWRQFPLLVWSCVWAMTGELRPKYTPGHFLLCHFVHISSITWKLWPSEVYQTRNTEIRNVRTEWRCGVREMCAMQMWLLQYLQAEKLEC